MKICKKCNVGKDESEYYVSRGNKGGLEGSCKSCKRLLFDKWYKSKRKVRIKMTPDEKRLKNTIRIRKQNERKALKNKASSCRRCGFIPENMCQLTIDHIDRNHKNNDINNLQTLCGNCHYLKTKIEMNEPDKLLELNLIPIK